MRQRGSGLHSKHLRVQWAQTHCVREPFDRIVWFAAPDSQEAAEEPGSRQVRIEHERPVKQRDAAIKVADEMVERSTASSEGDRIVLAQLHCPTGQSSTLGDLLRAIGHPT